jgi:hypothetical protein
MAPQKRGDEPVRVHSQSHEVGQERQGEDGDAHELLCHPSPSLSPPQHPPAGEPHGDTDGYADRQLDRRAAGPGRAVSALHGAGAGDRHHDDGSGDPIVQAALHGDQTAHAGRHSLVGHDRNAQGRVGRSQRRADQQRQPHTECR